MLILYNKVLLFHTSILYLNVISSCYLLICILNNLFLFNEENVIIYIYIYIEREREREIYLVNVLFFIPFSRGGN